MKVLNITELQPLDTHDTLCFESVLLSKSLKTRIGTDSHFNFLRRVPPPIKKG